MRKIFLIFSLIIGFGLFIFLIFPAVSFAAIGTVTTNIPAIGVTSATFSGTIDITPNDGAYDKRGFTYGTATANGGEYDLGTSTDTGSYTSDGNFTISTTTGLTAGTVYFFRMWAASSSSAVGDGAASLDLVYGAERSFLTGVNVPTSLSAQNTEDSIKIMWTAGTGSTKTTVRYNDGTTYPTATSSGIGSTVSGTSITFTPLPAEHTYYFSLWASTTATLLSTTSDSYATIRAVTTASSGGGVTRVAPTTYADSLVVSAGAATTNTRGVTLKLKASDAALMTVCNRSDLLNCPLESYATTKTWTLTEGDGVKTVYAKFVSQDGINSALVSDTITLKTVVEEVVTPAPVEEVAPVVEAAPIEEVATVAEAAPVEKPISEMTKEELTAKIAEIMAQVQALQAELTKLRVAVAFEVNMKYGDRGDDVVKLQEILIGEGLLGQGLNTGWFGPATKAAVIKFQEKYAEDILTPSGLAKGTGFVGPSTRAKLNELSGK